MKHIINILLSALLLCTINSCSEEYNGETISKCKIEISQSNFEIGALGGSLKANITSNTTWNFSDAESWINISSSSGRGNSSVSMIFSKNESGDSARVCSFKLTSGNVTITMKANQSAAQKTITITPSTINFSNQEGQSSVSIASNASWVVKNNADWLTLSAQEGGRSGNISITTLPNTTQKTRSANIVIAAGIVEKTLSVIQAAGTLPNLTTPNIQNITKDSALISSSFTTEFDVTEYGICYSTSTTTPTTASTKIVGSNLSDGTYSISATNLTKATTYYVRSYARSSVGIGYSEVMSFTTSDGKPGSNDNISPKL